MNEDRKHINEELKELGAENLLKAKVNSPKLPEDLKDDLLTHLDTHQSAHVVGHSRVGKILWPLGIAAALALGLFLLIPETSNNQLTFEDLSFEELEYMLSENINDYSDEDMYNLASNEVNIFEYSSIEEEYYEDEIVENLELTYEDLF